MESELREGDCVFIVKGFGVLSKLVPRFRPSYFKLKLVILKFLFPLEAGSKILAIVYLS